MTVSEQKESTREKLPGLTEVSGLSLLTSDLGPGPVIVILSYLPILFRAGSLLSDGLSGPAGGGKTIHVGQLIALAGNGRGKRKFVTLTRSRSFDTWKHGATLADQGRDDQSLCHSHWTSPPKRRFRRRGRRKVRSCTGEYCESQAFR